MLKLTTIVLGSVFTGRMNHLIEHTSFGDCCHDRSAIVCVRRGSARNMSALPEGTVLREDLRLTSHLAPS